MYAEDVQLKRGWLGVARSCYRSVGVLVFFLEMGSRSDLKDGVPALTYIEERSGRRSLIAMGSTGTSIPGCSQGPRRFWAKHKGSTTSWPVACAFIHLAARNEALGTADAVVQGGSTVQVSGGALGGSVLKRRAIAATRFEFFLNERSSGRGADRDKRLSRVEGGPLSEGARERVRGGYWNRRVGQSAVRMRPDRRPHCRDANARLEGMERAERGDRNRRGGDWECHCGTGPFLPAPLNRSALPSPP